jgi:hypothetical protein
MFAVLSAVATDTHDPDSIFDDHHAEDLMYEDPDDNDPRFMLELPPPPPRRGQDPDALEGLAPVPLGRQKKQLRQDNSDRVKMLSRLTTMDHAEINAKLNTEAGIQKIGEATVKQLQRRLGVADRWISRA